MASNLRILQWQVCKKKQDNLEFLIPWWDLQVGISINQFLSIFASSNSDFRFVFHFSSLFPFFKFKQLVETMLLVLLLSGTEHFHGCLLKVKVKN